MMSFCSGKLTSPREASCPLFLPDAHFFLSAACFALPFADLTVSEGLPVRFCLTFASPSTISSSTSSLRIAWAPQPHTAPSSGYAPPGVGTVWKAGRFSGGDFTIQPDGTLHCPARQELRVQEQRREIDGSLRVVDAAGIRSCRPCPKREQCQWNGNATHKPRQVSVLLHPLAVGSEPLLWRYSRRRDHRRACIQLLRHQRVEVQVESGDSATPAVKPATISRAQRAPYRLSWAERLARHARPETSDQVMIRLCGVPAGFATSLGLMTA
jgi:hypothetical protein